MSDLSDLAGEATSPLQKLMELLDPDKQQWLKGQPQERQQKLAQEWATSPFMVDMPGVTTNLGPDLKDPNLSSHANAFIQDAQDGKV